MPSADSRFPRIVEMLDTGQQPDPVTVRELLSWFDAKRRGYWIVEEIREALGVAGLRTVPDFNETWIDAPVSFVRLGTSRPDNMGTSSPEPAAANEPEGMPSVDDPAEPRPVATYRVSRLEAANRPPVFVSPQTSLNEAVTIMMANDFSQLPVMRDARDVKGVLSWRSIAQRFAVGRTDGEAREYMDAAIEVAPDASVFRVMSLLSDHEYVLVRGSDRTITGIVTTSDLTVQYRQWTEPFLLIGDIEQRLRGLIQGKFSTDDLRASCDPEDARPIDSVHNLTFGELIRIIDNPEHWKRLALPLARKPVIELLTKARETRNDVMHFDPDGIADQDLDRLRRAVDLLDRIGILVPAAKTSG